MIIVSEGTTITPFLNYFLYYFTGKSLNTFRPVNLALKKYLQDFTFRKANKPVIICEVISLYNGARLVLSLVLCISLLLVRPPVTSASGAVTFEAVFEYVQNMHISSPQVDKLYEGAINGLIDTLADPYSEYMDPEALKDFNASLQGAFVGVGIELVPGEGYPSVLRTIEGSPAEKAGIRAGDVIIQVDQDDLFEASLPRVIQKIRGLEGSPVRLTILRGGEPLEFDLLRSSISLPSVYSELLGGGLGYISIKFFGGSTADEFEAALAELQQKGAEKLVLDLRDDPGGYLQAAVQIAGSFIEKGKTVVSIVDNKQNRQVFYAEGDASARNMPLAILVNSSTASAAEILAGALQHYGMAGLIGERTFGKGTVQTIIPLENGGALKLTTARYHTPDDRIIDHTGLEPDIQVLTPTLQLLKAKNYLNPPLRTTIIFEHGTSEASVNGTIVKLPQGPLLQDGVYYLPLRFVFEALGYQVDWHPDEGRIKVKYIQNERSLLEGHNVTITGPVINHNDIAFIPLTALKQFNFKTNVVKNRITVEK
ncbi:MAG: PDZ domain-containing protein [Peptococcaceae bacterium]|jgi:carboxyl-terminal processing protease|nr:PDZ domain-containing protein [Peptococcaceae bacterium]